jgi:hypothetical protein
VHELEHGSPAFAPLSNAEWVEWLAILSIVEPEEARKASKRK